MDEDRILTIKGASQLLKLHVSTINRLIEAGQIPSHKVGGRRLFDREELIEWVRSYNSHGVQRTVKAKPKKRQ
jgi:excisionase family DNA binding protein